MSENILAWFGWLVEHAYMISVIAFVALQFGWIKRGETPVLPASGTPGESGKGVNPKMDVGSMIQGFLGQMGPMLNQMAAAPGVPTQEEPAAQIEGSPTIKPRTFD